MTRIISKIAAGCLALVAIVSWSCAGNAVSPKMSDEEIIADIQAHQPGLGATIPADIKSRLGATHVDGKYYFTQEPYLIEGSRKISEMGFGILKLWLAKSLTGYSFNSEWNMPENFSCKDLVSHPYYKSAIDLPFSTIALMVSGKALETTAENAHEDEQEFYELSKYLLTEYADRQVTFILQNWEGDWILRGGTGPETRWARFPKEGVTCAVPADTTERVEALKLWFAARQRGLERARAEVPKAKCRVYHAVETNKVYDAIDGLPGIINDILPNVPVDMVSWSSYDGLTWDSIPDNGVKLYRGIDFIKSKMNPSKYMNGKKVLYLGELGMPEQAVAMSDETIVKNWDTFLGVCLAQDIPQLFIWELFCNEPFDASKRELSETRTLEELQGFWLIRPDGSLSLAGEYFTNILKNAGRTLTTANN